MNVNKYKESITKNISNTQKLKVIFDGLKSEKPSEKDMWSIVKHVKCCNRHLLGTSKSKHRF